MVGAYKLDGGVWKIGIPEDTLKLDPHTIMDTAPLEPDVEGGKSFGGIQFIISTLALAFALYILFRRLF